MSDQQSPLWTPWDGDNTPPIHTDELGVKYWHDKSSQQYAKLKGVNVVCLFAELPTGERQRVIAENGRVMFEATSLDAIACHIDVMAFASGEPAWWNKPATKLEAR